MIPTPPLMRKMQRLLPGCLPAVLLLALHTGPWPATLAEAGHGRGAVGIDAQTGTPTLELRAENTGEGPPGGEDPEEGEVMIA